MKIKITSIVLAALLPAVALAQKTSADALDFGVD
jgi:hypothetical protein